MKHQTKSESKYNIFPDQDFDVANAVSTSELTGLMYRPALNEEQYEFYGDLIEFEPQDIIQTHPR